MINYIIEQTIKLINIPSVSKQEGDILFYIEEELDKDGIEYIRQRVEDGWYNLLVGNPDSPYIILSAHVDTVPPMDGLPPKASIKGNTIYGLGSCDVKNGVAILLALIKEFKQIISEKNLLFALTVDEEKEGLGSETLAKSIKKAKGAIVIEPTSLKICTKQAGTIELIVEVMGKPAHGACKEEGENAIEKAIEVIQSFPTLSFMKKEDPDLGKACFNIINITGGDEHLRVPGYCAFQVDFRIMPDTDIEMALDEINNFFKEKGVYYHLVDIGQGFSTDKSNYVVEKLVDSYKDILGKDPDIAGMRSWTDADNFSLAGIPSIVFGAGDLCLCHTTEEKIDIDEIEKCYNILKRFIEII